MQSSEVIPFIAAGIIGALIVPTILRSLLKSVHQHIYKIVLVIIFVVWLISQGNLSFGADGVPVPDDLSAFTPVVILKIIVGIVCIALVASRRRFLVAGIMAAMLCHAVYAQAGWLDGLLGSSPEQIRAENERLLIITGAQARAREMDKACDLYSDDDDDDIEERVSRAVTAATAKRDYENLREKYGDLKDSLDKHKGLIAQQESDNVFMRRLAIGLFALTLWALGMFLFERRDRNRERDYFERLLIQYGFRPEHIVNSISHDNSRLYPVVKR